MKTNTFTVLPFLVALVVGLAAQPLPIVDVHAWNAGVEHLTPTQTRSSTLEVESPATTLGGRLMRLATSERGEATIDLLTAGVPSGIKELRQRKADVAKAARENLTAKAESWQARDDQYSARMAEVNDAITREERLQDVERTMVVGRDGNTDVARAAERAAGIQPGKDHAEDDPKRGFKDHRDFLAAVMNAGKGMKLDSRLLPLRATQGSDEQGAYSDPHGGFLVPHGVAPGILSIRPEDDVLSGRVNEVPMMAPTVTYNARVDKDHTTSVSGGLVVTRHPETVDASSTRMKFEQVTLTANERFGLAFATERIITDSPESFVAIIAAGFNDEYAAKTMDERLNGSGVGEPLGVLHANNGCLVSVAKETGQAADTVVKENIDKMISRIWRPSSAVFLANHDTRPQLKSVAQQVGTGGMPVPYFTNSNGQEYLDGKPIFFTEFASKLGDVGDLILGNWSEYLWGTYQPMRSDESIHVRFAAGERCFRFYDRNDGQCWWKSALTPKKSAATLSPFVVLAAR